MAESVSSKAAHSSKQWRTSSSKSINCPREESQGGIERANGTAYKSLHTGEVARWILEGRIAEVKDGEENKPAFSLPQCSHHKILDFQLVPPELGVVDVGMLELKRYLY